MAGSTDIEWATKVWNPIAGCSVVSQGCTNCYAMKMAARVSAMAAGRGQTSTYDGLTKNTKAGAVWTGEVRLVEDALLQPLRWTKPQRIFANSMSDLFHEAVPIEVIAKVFAVAGLADQHTIIILTKRADRMREILNRADFQGMVAVAMMELAPVGRQLTNPPVLAPGQPMTVSRWPLPNVWLGASIEDQERLNERMPELVATPAAVRLVSAEPMLGELDFRRWLNIAWKCSSCRSYFSGAHRPSCPDCGALGGWTGSHVFNGRHRRPNRVLPHQSGSAIDLIIIGGESGPRARPCWTPHVRSVVRQGAQFGTPVFVKQLGANVQDRNDAGFDGMGPSHWPDIDLARVEHDLDGARDDYQGAPVRIRLSNRKGSDMAEWPADLRVRQLPEAVAA